MHECGLPPKACRHRLGTSPIHAVASLEPDHCDGTGGHVGRIATRTETYKTPQYQYVIWLGRAGSPGRGTEVVSLGSWSEPPPALRCAESAGTPTDIFGHLRLFPPSLPASELPLRIGAQRTSLKSGLGIRVGFSLHGWRQTGVAGSTTFR
jgi:hypothetical protein